MRQDRVPELCSASAGALSPRRLLALVTRAQSRLGLYFNGGFRVAAGAVLLQGASASRAPLHLEVLGWLSLVSGNVTPLVGVRRFEVMLGWWRRRSPWTLRLWSCLVIVFGRSQSNRGTTGPGDGRGVGGEQAEGLQGRARSNRHRGRRGRPMGNRADRSRGDCRSSEKGEKRALADRLFRILTREAVVFWCYLHPLLNAPTVVTKS